MDVVPQSPTPDIQKLPGGWIPDTDFILKEQHVRPSFKVISDSIWLAENILSEHNCRYLIQRMQQSGKACPVSVQGKTDNMSKGHGSKRATAWSPQLAGLFWSKIKEVIPSIKTTNSYSPTDCWQPPSFKKWKPVGLSPLLRFMQYEKNSQHFPHYDAGYIYPDPQYRSLMSVIFYLTTDTTSGATRFLNDGQTHLPTEQRNFADWNHAATANDVSLWVYPKQGNVLLFDHRLCHDAAPHLGDTPRIIIRGDLVFKGIDE